MKKMKQASTVNATSAIKTNREIRSEKVIAQQVHIEGIAIRVSCELWKHEYKVILGLVLGITKFC